MLRSHRWPVATLVVTVALLLSACAQKAPATATKPKPVTIEKIAGSSISKVILTDEAVVRIDLKTEPIGEVSDSGTQRRAMPYTAIIYDKAGETWAYTASGEPRTFVRQSIKVDAIEGGVVYLADGPAAGTQVVTVGVAELYGAEY